MNYSKKGLPQFHIPLNSTHQFYTKERLLLSLRKPSVPHQKPLSSIHSSVPHQKPLSSTHPLVPPPQFHTQIPQFNTCFSSTLKTLSSTRPSDKDCVEPRGLSCGTEGCLELRSFRCGTEGVQVLNWEVFGVELRGFRFGTEVFLVLNWGIWVLKRCGPCVEPMYWTEGVCVELRGSRTEKWSPKNWNRD